MRNFKIMMAIMVLSALTAVTLNANNPSNNMNVNEEMNETPAESIAGDLSNHLLIVWTSGDHEVAQKNGWGDQVPLLVWGPSSKLSCENKEIQEALKKMQQAGVELIACKPCADQYACSSDLENLGIEVKYTGTFLTDFIKSGKKVITF